ncbi:hypothetical protein TNCV_3050811 [Trichonephila clavipes]|nr:hypothetical protein TNCV_3050811 [Trichonephila clavipes]
MILNLEHYFDPVALTYQNDEVTQRKRNYSGEGTRLFTRQTEKRTFLNKRLQRHRTSNRTNSAATVG